MGLENNVGRAAGSGLGRRRGCRFWVVLPLVVGHLDPLLESETIEVPGTAPVTPRSVIRPVVPHKLPPMPIGRAPRTVSRDSLSVPSSRARSGVPSVDLSKLTVLFVDDERLNRRIAKRYLQQLSVKCDVATDGDEVLPLSREKEYDVFILDIIMAR